MYHTSNLILDSLFKPSIHYILPTYNRQSHVDHTFFLIFISRKSHPQFFYKQPDTLAYLHEFLQKK